MYGDSEVLRCGDISSVILFLFLLLFPLLSLSLKSVGTVNTTQGPNIPLTVWQGKSSFVRSNHEPRLLQLCDWKANMLHVTYVNKKQYIFEDNFENQILSSLLRVWIVTLISCSLWISHSAIFHVLCLYCLQKQVMNMKHVWKQETVYGKSL